MAELIKTDEQKLAVGTIVNLFTLDVDGDGGVIYRFVTGPFNDKAVVYQGVTYRPVPIKVEGIAMGGDGAAKRPRLTISRIDKTIIDELADTRDLRGGTLKRLRTLSKYLDGETDADPARHWPEDIFTIERLVSQGAKTLTWELAGPLDFDNKQIPGRQILRDICAWRYRRLNGDSFDYSDATCPYTAERYFDGNDKPTKKAAEDKCSRRLSGCRARFGNQPLPFGGFAGVARVRQ